MRLGFSNGGDFERCTVSMVHERRPFLQGGFSSSGSIRNPSPLNPGPNRGSSESSKKFKYDPWRPFLVSYFRFHPDRTQSVPHNPISSSSTYANVDQFCQKDTPGSPSDPYPLLDFHPCTLGKKTPTPLKSTVNEEASPHSFFFRREDGSSGHHKSPYTYKISRGGAEI